MTLEEQLKAVLAENDELKREIAALKQPTPIATLPPLVDGPRRAMEIIIEVGANFEQRLDNQWEVEREIHADRWTWRWANIQAQPPRCE